MFSEGGVWTECYVLYEHDGPWKKKIAHALSYARCEELIEHLRKPVQKYEVT